MLILISLFIVLPTFEWIEIKQLYDSKGFRIEHFIIIYISEVE